MNRQTDLGGAFGLTWEQIQSAQSGNGIPRERVAPSLPGQDYGADPVGDGTFRMIPSGDVVGHAERNRRLS